VRTAARARRPPQVPEWLTELAQSSGGPAPWAQMSHAVLAIAAPVAVGLAAGHLVAGLLAGVGGLLATMADRTGPYLMRVRRVATAAVFGGAAGLLIGMAIYGRGWVAVPVMIVVAGISALLSSVGAVWSSAGLFLLIYAALGTGPVGALRPWWLTLLWFLAGVGWWLVLLVPGWLAFPRAVEQRRVAAVYRALAVNLRALGTEDLGAARRRATAALNLAFEELLGQRAAASGRDRELALLMSLIRQARLAAEAAAALDYAGERPPPQAAAHAEALASAVLDGAAVPAIEAPPTASRAMLALYRALNRAAADVSGRTAPRPGAIGDADWPREPARPLLVLARQVRWGFVSMFAIRLMLCIGVATVLSQALPLQRSYWVPLTVAVVLRPDLGSVFARALQSAAGTVIGASVGALILAARPPGQLVVIWLAVFALALPYGLSRNYGLFTAFFAPLVVLLIDLLSNDGWQLAQDRLIDTLLGCGIALLIGYAPWPSSWLGSWRPDFADTLGAIAGYLDQAVGQGTRGTAPHARARIQLATLQTEFQRAMAEPQWIRQRAMAWQPAVAALERLLDTVTATAVTTAGQPPSGTDVSEVSAALRRIAGAARSGTPARPQALPSEPSLKPVIDAARSIADALDGMPRQRRQSLVARNTQAGDAGSPADLRWHGEPRRVRNKLNAFTERPVMSAPGTGCPRGACHPAGVHHYGPSRGPGWRGVTPSSVPVSGNSACRLVPAPGRLSRKIRPPRASTIGTASSEQQLTSVK